MKRIVVISHGYPSAAKPNECTFVQELAEMWRRQGRDVCVVKPVPWLEYVRIIFCRDEAYAKNHYPPYADYTLLRAFRFFPALRRLHIRLADRSFQKAVERTVRLREDDVLYAHFLDSGFCAAALTEKYGIPSFCAVGESSLWTLEFKDMAEVLRRMGLISGFISVSGRNTNMLTAHGLAGESRIVTIPNAVNTEVIRRLDRAACRQKLNLVQDAIIGIFVGRFCERKGVKHVVRATEGIEGLRMMYIGQGEEKPECSNAVYIGPVRHEEIAVYLSAADFFILPTLAEGCCNAIVEAMNCGLPVISSDSDFNDDILTDECAIRVNPRDADQLRAAVVRLCTDRKLMTKMGQAALSQSKRFDLAIRAKRILDYMEQSIAADTPLQREP